MKIAVWGQLEMDMRTMGGPAGLLDRCSAGGITTYLANINRFDPADRGEIAYASRISRITSADCLRPLVDAARRSPVRVQPWWLPGNRIPLDGETDASREAFTYRAADPAGAKKHRRNLCLTWPQVRQRAVRMLRDLIEAGGPNLTGVHMDVVRYSDNPLTLTKPCQCDACVAMYQREIGLPTVTAEDLREPGVLFKFVQARGRNVREMVEEAVDVTRRAGLELSMAGRGDYHNNALPEGQDWAQWARDGLISFVATMNYSVNFDTHHRLTVRNEAVMSGARAEHYAGVGKSSSMGELGEADFARWIADVVAAGADAVCVYHLAALTPADLDVLAGLDSRPRLGAPASQGV